MPPNQVPQQNPYAGIIDGFLSRNGGNQPPSQPPSQPATQPLQPTQGNGTKEANVPPNITELGVGNPTSQALIGAMGNLQNFIKSSQDKDDIAIAQTIISLLADLIQREKSAQNRINEAPPS